MKIRNGFVSNSSSSSFIVVLDKKPENPSELKKVLFGKHNIIVEGELYRNYWRNIPLDTFTLLSVTSCKGCNKVLKLENRGNIPFDIVMESPAYQKLIKRE
jgi:hypothetical protein